MKKYIALLLLIIFPFVASATTPDNNTTEIPDQRKGSDANLVGHIIDAGTSLHIPYATVALKGTTIGCAANGTGHYTINNIPVGEHTIVVSAIGYETKEVSFRAVPRTSEELNFSLAESTTMVDQVVVSATRICCGR